MNQELHNLFYESIVQRQRCHSGPRRCWSGYHHHILPSPHGRGAVGLGIIITFYLRLTPSFTISDSIYGRNIYATLGGIHWERPFERHIIRGLQLGQCFQCQQSWSLCAGLGCSFSLVILINALTELFDWSSSKLLGPCRHPSKSHIPDNQAVPSISMLYFLTCQLTDLPTPRWWE